MRQGEFELISRIRSMFSAPEGILGIGDDCAVIPRDADSDFLVSTDLLVENVHFLLKDIPPRDLGWKSAAVNFSDIAAMGGSPVGSFLSLALPSSVTDEWIGLFMEGYREMSEAAGAPLLGGDTTRSPGKLCVNVTVIGECGHGRAVLRSGARTGDLICVTGTLGNSAAGLKLIIEGLDGAELEKKFIAAHYHPEPRLDEGSALSDAGVHCMMDISDGLGSDLRHILNASGKGATIYTGKIPLDGELVGICSKYGWRALELAVNGGEDYELLFTVDKRTEKTLGVRHHVIGVVDDAPGIRCEGIQVKFEGFRHF